MFGIPRSPFHLTRVGNSIRLKWVNTIFLLLQDATEEDNMFFKDGVRRIDYVMAFEPGAYEGDREENRSRKREYYQNELEKEGLQLEFEPIEVITLRGLRYSKPF